MFCCDIVYGMEIGIMKSSHSNFVTEGKGFIVPDGGEKVVSDPVFSKTESIVSSHEKKDINEDEIILPDIAQLKNVGEILQNALCPQLCILIDHIKYFLKADKFSTEICKTAHKEVQLFFNVMDSLLLNVNSFIAFPVNKIATSERNVLDVVQYEFLQKKLSSFRRGVNHDLRSPFNAILGFINLLGEPGNEAKDVNKFKEIILKDVESLPLLFGKVFLLAEEVHFEDIATENLLQKDKNLLEMNANQKDILLKFNISKEVSLFSDSARLDSILRNLINNAIKFTKPLGEILVNVYLENGRTVFSVQDRGIGMTKETLQETQEIFNSNNPEKESMENHSKGTNEEPTTGEGLILSKGYADLIFGDLAVESEKGKGTTVTLSLPAEKKEVLERDCLVKKEKDNLIKEEVQKRKIGLLKKRFVEAFNGVMEKK